MGISLRTLNNLPPEKSKKNTENMAYFFLHWKQKIRKNIHI